ncbi:MerR HTH family regulatory protein [Clostridium aceticum]|uniref:MerR HTH family regulatory protein n=1 Tax=Clostridium aceticum TaxID=84022 RepID=A0A0G3WE44_9CLOT|nr:MerR family transcriptional regulator [Clostridium aceticum]AKL96120.1 MerR HTH family regulatory protein [Clostridium aceticum]
MLINEISKITELTKKAIEYYVEKELISPSILEKGDKGTRLLR